MKWSQVKKRIEASFADSVVGRVQVWNTRYRRSHDQEGEAWITIDRRRIWSMGTYTYLIESYREANRLRQESHCTDNRDREQQEGYYKAYDDADKLMSDRGVFSLSAVNSALFEYLNLSIDNAIKSDNPIIRAFATLDRRFGKRRVEAFDDSKEHPLVIALYRFRCKAEGINKEPEPVRARGLPTR